MVLDGDDEDTGNNDTNEIDTSIPRASASTQVGKLSKGSRKADRHGEGKGERSELQHLLLLPAATEVKRPSAGSRKTRAAVAAAPPPSLITPLLS